METLLRFARVFVQAFLVETVEQVGFEPLHDGEGRPLLVHRIWYQHKECDASITLGFYHSEEGWFTFWINPWDRAAHTRGFTSSNGSICLTELTLGKNS